jgi:YVTN family beta-propeller protein
VVTRDQSRAHSRVARRQYARRRLAALAAVVALLALVSFGVSRLFGGPAPSEPAAADQRPVAAATGKPTATQTKPPETTAAASTPSAGTSMERVRRITGQMSPKSVVASTNGQVFAQNMMYTHTVSVFDAAGDLRETIPDSVTLADYGIQGHPGVSRGAPVEMAFTPDNKHGWVSNYSMYGANFGPEGKDSCQKGDGTDESFVYKINTESYAIEKVVPVGAVPKYVAVTPNGKLVLVTNWCTWDLSIIDTESNREVARVPLPGTYPRGIVVTKDSRTAYVALMGSDEIVSVDLHSRRVSPFSQPGDSPRHIVMSPDEKYIYVTNNRSGDVVKVSRATGQVVGSAITGKAPRSMAISPDGTAIYVVNYESSTVSKVRTRDMKVLETDPTDGFPIGITYEPTKKAVWVACYGGSILVYDDTKRPVA